MTEALVGAVQAMARGEVEGLAALWDATAGTVRAALRARVREDVATAALLQQTYLDLWQMAPCWDRYAGDPLSWVLAAADERANDWLAARKRARLWQDGPAVAEIGTGPVAERFAALPAEDRATLRAARFGGTLPDGGSPAADAVRAALVRWAR